MSIAILNQYRNSTTDAQDAPSKPTATLQAVPTQTEARGFALYVGLDEASAAAAGVNLAEVVAALRQTIDALVPGAARETFAAVALAPVGTGGRNVDVVRTALHDPRALDRLVEANQEQKPASGVILDTLRQRVYVDGTNAEFTSKEFELLNYLVSNQGETITRRELIDAVWSDDADNAPNDRTIDVHVRRLRAKIVGYEDIIRTVRGAGYRFDKHPDLLVEA